jgi:hypothetical protein
MTLDPAIISLAEYACRELLAEVRRGEFDGESLGAVPAVSLVVQIAAEARAAGTPLPVSILRLEELAVSSTRIA